MKTIVINLPDDYAFATKANGQNVMYDPAKMHESWIIRFLEKGFQRYANDLYSGEKGQVKYDLCLGVAQEAQSGEPAPERMRGGTARLPDDVSLALKNARASLTIMLKKATGKGSAIDFAQHDKGKVFFSIKDGKAIWDNEMVQMWIAKQLAGGKRDYLQEAKDTLAIDTDDLDLDL